MASLLEQNRLAKHYQLMNRFFHCRLSLLSLNYQSCTLLNTLFTLFLLNFLLTERFWIFSDHFLLITLIHILIILLVIFLDFNRITSFSNLFAYTVATDQRSNRVSFFFSFPLHFINHVPMNILYGKYFSPFLNWGWK